MERVAGLNTINIEQYKQTKTMKRKRLLLCVLLPLCGTTVNTQADVLELKNGQVHNGRYIGGTASTLRFDTGGGTQVIETSQIIALTFTSSGAAAAPTPTPAAPAPQQIGRAHV